MIKDCVLTSIQHLPEGMCLLDERDKIYKIYKISTDYIWKYLKIVFTRFVEIFGIQTINNLWSYIYDT